MTFLARAAESIFERHGTQMDHVWVIVPTRRAVSYFQQHLSEYADIPFLSPHTLAIDDFITRSAGVELVDPVGLLFELYEVFKSIDASLEFNRFLNWAGILLSDFDRIDQYLISPSELFSYLTAAKILERWQPDLPPDKATTLVTDGTQQYFKLFENLHLAYTTLHERLSAKGMAYRGMAYRRLAEHIDDWVSNNPGLEKVYFVGFNALSRSEEHIVRRLVRLGMADLFWDTDSYYMQNRNQEAGKLLRKYKNEGWSGSWTWEEKHLTETPKNIQIIGLPNASMQAKVASHFYETWRQQDPEGTHPSTALVLGDETLLLPVLYSLDGMDTELNVTMGLSLKNSVLFTLIDALFEMQRTAVLFQTKDQHGSSYIPKFSHRHVVRLLGHPFLRQYEELVLRQRADRISRRSSLLQAVVETITTQNYVYLGEQELQELGESEELFRILFTRWPDDKPLWVIRQFYQLIDLLKEVYVQKQDAIEIEYIYLFQGLLQQLEAALEREERKELVDIRSLKQFLYELIRQTSLPFESEGSGSLQVMGMLETRALDFERLIILSVNEGVLPKARKWNSLIPFDACQAVGLPTYQDQESVMAYHFYRLLQRAKEIVLLYVTSPDAYGASKGEKSRFILQLEHELHPAAQGTISISYPMVHFGRVVDEKRALVVDRVQIPKSEPILNQLREQLLGKLTAAGHAFGGLYPTQLNNFLSCSLRYYFSRVIDIGQEEEVDERMGANEFGIWIHRTLETLDQQYRMQGICVDDVVVKQVLELEYRELFRNRVIESGMNLLLYRIGEDLLVRFNEQQVSKYNGCLDVLQTEKEYDTTLDVSTAIGIIPVRIAGKIDRVERLRQPDGSVVIRIADYKTGKIEAREVDVKTVDMLLTDPKLDKARQLWLYQYLVYKKMLQEGGLHLGNEWLDGTTTQIVAGFYSFRNLEADFIESKLHLGDPEHYVEQTEGFLRDLIGRLFDPSLPFEKTENKKVCEWCEFRKLCRR